MAEPTLGFAVIGATGLFASTYLDAAGAVPELELRAIAARREQPLREVSAAYGHPDIHTRWQAVLERHDIDVVAVVTSNAEHCPITLAALRAGKHVICEKPLANTAADARAMYAAAVAARRGHVVGHFMRLSEPVRMVKQLLDADELGEVQALFAYIWAARAPHEPAQWWMTAAECPAGSMGLIGVHFVDLARYLTDSEVLRVFAHLPTLVTQRPDLGAISRRAANAWSAARPDGSLDGLPMTSVDASDYGTLHAVLANGALLTISAGQTTFTRPGPLPDLQVHGTRASAFVYLGDGRLAPAVRLVRGTDGALADVPLREQASYRAQNARMFRDEIIPALRGRAEGREGYAAASFYDGWKAAEVIDAALVAHQTGAWADVGG
ncbi:MAG: Gfo/Idh/MocA family oxidoreductase [Actinobacteria bacterium]|nr:Gfo/Idh/MocA family oxidoreductase [Actinomycetota bacterium]